MIKIPEEELKALAALMDEGYVVPLLRDRNPQRVRRALTRHSDRVWLFPFGGRPADGQPVMVYVNGLLVMEHHEVVLLRVGKARQCTVAVFDRILDDRDVVIVDYMEIS